MCTPTDEPVFVGFTKTGYGNASSTASMNALVERCARWREISRQGTTGTPASRSTALVSALSMHSAVDEHAAADVRNAGHLEHALQRAVLAAATVDDRKDHVERRGQGGSRVVAAEQLETGAKPGEARLRVGMAEDRFGQELELALGHVPAPVVAYTDQYRRVARRIERLEDGGRRRDGDFVLRRPAPEDDAHALLRHDARIAPRPGLSLTLLDERPYPARMITAVADSSASSDARAKEAALLARLADTGTVVVAYSGGVDSAYLAWAAHRALGPRALAVTAISPSYPRSHRELAERTAREVGFRHEWIHSTEHENPDYARNAPDRCYFCKSELFERLETLRAERGFAAVAYGINCDDTSDFRPGHRAADEHHVLSPLLDAGLSKREIRALAADAGLSAAELPASACLSSRVPYGMEVTPAKLAQIDRAEDALRALGYRQLRVRHHGDLARVELAREELPRALSPERLREISRALHDAGFRWVSLDVDGYRTGSANEVLQIEPPRS